MDTKCLVVPTRFTSRYAKPLAQPAPIQKHDVMKDFIAGEIKSRIASAVVGQVASIVEDPVGFFTPHQFKITVYAFLGRKGEWVISKGADKVSPALAVRIVNFCKSNGLTDGWIAFKKEDGQTRVDCDPSWPENIRQRISNLICMS